MKKNMKKWVCGDVHGEYEKLKGLLEKIEFDYDNDQFVSLGDIVDRGPDSYKCIEELLKIKHLIAVRGNHDACFRDSIKTGAKNTLYDQGGRETLLSYTRDTECGGDPCKIPFEHINFFINKQQNYYLEGDVLFVHGGFNRHYPIEEQSETTLLWNRDLFLSAIGYENMRKDSGPFKMKGEYSMVFIGHTPTTYYGSDKPMQVANIINLDTGCGKSPDAYLTAMNYETGQIVQFR